MSLMLYITAIGFLKLQTSLQSAEHLTCFNTYTHGTLMLLMGHFLISVVSYINAEHVETCTVPSANNK